MAIAVFLPLFVPLDPLKTDYGAIRQPPGPGHPLGADLSGRDIFARVVYGTRVSLVVGFGAVALYLVVGTTLGMIAGFSGGLRDQVIMRFTDVLLAIPLILLCIVFISIVGPGPRLGHRGHRPAGLAAHDPASSGASCCRCGSPSSSPRAASSATSSSEIARRHLMPNILGPLTVVATFGVAQAILLEASLSFLGLGVRPPVPSLGEMINAATAPSTLQTMPWVWLPPGIVIALLVLSVNFIGDGVRDALDPRSTRRG